MALNVHRFGPIDGPPLVALHGLTGHGGRWSALAAEQLPNYCVFAPDLRGHGRSVGSPPWTLERHADDVAETMQHLGLDHAPIMGHSLGATVAVYLARCAPGRVARLILLDPGVGLRLEVAEQRARDALRAPEFDNPTQAAEERARFWPVEAHRLVDDEVRSHLAEGDDGRWRWRYSVPVAVATYSELARPFVVPPPDTPTLLVIAGRSRAVSPAFVEACQSQLGASFSVAEIDCGHQVHLERPAETGRLVREFLARPFPI